jgi:hypothetical protein
MVPVTGSCSVAFFGNNTIQVSSGRVLSHMIMYNLSLSLFGVLILAYQYTISICLACSFISGEHMKLFSHVWLCLNRE